MQKTLLAIIAAAVVTIGLTVNFAAATHEPADKTAATASDIDTVGEEGTDENGDLLLSETMRVSSTSDLILQTTAECSILTSLNTSGGPNTATESDGAFGQVKLWIEIDGERVPVSEDDTATDSNGENDTGEVVFCNRAYQRTVTDNEQDEDGAVPDPAGVKDGIDTEDDFIRTRTANGFNWMAFNVGKAYDKDANNLVTVNLYAEYDRKTSESTGGEEPTIGATNCGDQRDDDDLTSYGATCADAYVGSRSLIVEAVHASNHEQAEAGTD